MKSLVLFSLALFSLPLFAAAPLYDDFDSSEINSSVWDVADGWGNGDFTSTFWLKQQMGLVNGALILELAESPCSGRKGACKGKTNAGAELRSRQRMGNVSVSTAMKAAKGEGVITAIFKYTGPYHGDPHDEIDIEILGKDPTKLHLNYWVNGESKLTKVIDLGFDASEEMHRYGWSQTSHSIRWMVDDKVVHEVMVEKPEQLPMTPGKVMVSIWAAQPETDTATQWAGNIKRTQLPVRAVFDWIRIE